MTNRSDEEHSLHLARSLGTSRIFPTNKIFVEPKNRIRARASSRESIETFEERPILAKYKEGDNFNRRNTLSISRIEI
jgi:hypothetical protein